MRYLLIALLLAGCSTTPLQQKREDVLSCVKDLIGNGATTAEAFEVCRQVYEMRKVKD